jgi:hypothetical protein
MIYDGKDIEDLLVRFEQLGISYTNALALFHSQSRQISCSMLLYMLCMIIKDIICLRMSRYSSCKKYITIECHDIVLVKNTLLWKHDIL